MSLFASSVFGQRYFFKQEYAPNSEYEMASKVLVKMITNSEIEIYSEKEYHLITSEIIKNKTPFTLQYSTKNMKIKVNEKEVPTKSNPISNVKVSGEVVEGNNIVISKIHNLDTSLHSIVKGNLNLISFNKVDFPKNGIQIGDLFEQRVVFQIPNDKKDVNIIITYRLTNVINDNAYFDIEKATIDKNRNEDINMELKGVAEFDVKNGYFSKIEMKIEISSHNKIGKINEVIYQKKLK